MVFYFTLKPGNSYINLTMKAKMLYNRFRCVSQDSCVARVYMSLERMVPEGIFRLDGPLAETVELDYQVCAHCGFRLMHVLPPTRKTFPLPVLYCPICGLRQDDSGFTPGKALTYEAKLEALRRWLQQQGLDEETLREQYHLELGQFFEPHVARRS